VKRTRKKKVKTKRVRRTTKKRVKTKRVVRTTEQKTKIVRKKWGKHNSVTVNLKRKASN
jgi:hypothetical protein